MNSAGTATYCIFCISGHESKVVSRLCFEGHIPLTPQVVRWKQTESGLVKKACQLLPGYVFFDADTTPNWSSIRMCKDVLRILQYDDGERALRGSDLEFVAWLKHYQGIIEISQAIQVGTRLQFVDGPLKDMAAKVVKVNKNRRQVQITLGDESNMLHSIWCSIEFIETNTDGAVARC